MFFFARTLREKVVMAGGMLAFVVVILVAIWLVFSGGLVQWVFAAGFAAVPPMIVKGWRVGYSLGKFIVGLLAIVLIGGALSAFTYGEFAGGKGNYPLFVTLMVLMGGLMFFAFYGLEQHLKLRNMEKSQAHAACDEQ